MDFGIKGKKALVTASSSGIGKAVAESLAKEGADLILCARRENLLKDISEKLSSEYNVDTSYERIDLSKKDEIESLLRKYNKVDILFVNAGGPKAGEFDTVGDEDWYNTFELNMMSAIRLIRGVLPYMKERKFGRIVVLTSISVKQVMDNLILSNSIRMGITGMIKSVSKEVAKYGITVNGVAPGWTRTARVENLLKSKAELSSESIDEIEKTLVKDIPMKRMAKPEEIADVVTFLCSSKASYITGITINVDGGYCKNY
jgi:3-oxoacyl-[acyl-carrier protein] reductase